ncbi:conserved protein of unknown function [Pseudomonas marincola]|uniref:Uncharacterized protein n=1 Tax=Pseudomonas marincola TaxID=437900 RepID=A0A653E9F2_9PSED|nr:conserved protein of unknown function [Pseudomonas marincola]
MSGRLPSAFSNAHFRLRSSAWVCQGVDSFGYDRRFGFAKKLLRLPLWLKILVFMADLA